MKKKVIIITLVIIAFISSVSFITFKVVSKDSRNVNQLSNPVKEEKEKEPIAEDEKDDSKENQEESKTNDSNNQKEEVKEEPKQETSSNGSPTTNKANSNNNTATTPKQEEVPKQNPNVQTPNPAPTKSCTPKKFYSVFRADEDIKSMEDCNSKGALYKSVYGYIGYSCDYQTDDCGDLYYMLQMIDENGQEHGYNTIPKP